MLSFDKILWEEQLSNNIEQKRWMDVKVFLKEETSIVNDLK